MLRCPEPVRSLCLVIVLVVQIELGEGLFEARGEPGEAAEEDTWQVLRLVRGEQGARELRVEAL